MTPREALFLGFAVLGGLALFMFGMRVMTDGLRQAAGTRLRHLLSATRNRFLGLAVGTVLGFLVHSSAATVMLVGFVNAGLMPLAQSIPTMLGANVGTTLSMQLISFKLDQYSFLVIAVGFLVQMILPQPRFKQVGQAVFGFGLLFLGMKTMSGAIGPHRELFAPYLAQIDGRDPLGMMLGVGIATLVTSIIQSSGATIGMAFAMISGGVFTELAQVYPIILGAHIGTCVTAIIGSIGTGVEAKRTAIAHVSFNVINVAIAIAAAPLYLKLIPLTSPGLIHQAANAHTAVQVVGAVLVLPVSGLFAKLITWIAYPRQSAPQPSFLDRGLLKTPEQAVDASIRELRRVTEICIGSLHLNAHVLFGRERKAALSIKLNERIVNDIKLAMKDYLMALTRRRLSRRQAILIQYIDQCMIDIERVGDHIDEFGDISIRRGQLPQALFDKACFDALFDLYESAIRMLKRVAQSLDPDLEHIDEAIDTIMAARDESREISTAARNLLTEEMEAKTMAPVAGIFYREYLSALDRTVQHAANIALTESQPDFRIKKKKLARVAKRAENGEPPMLVDPTDYLKRLDSM